MLDEYYEFKPKMRNNFKKKNLGKRVRGKLKQEIFNEATGEATLINEKKGNKKYENSTKA